MKKYDIAILTDSRYESPISTAQYIQNILLEDHLLQEALERKGLKVIRLDWAKKDFDWSSVGCAIFRSTWDYQDKFEEFKQWLEQVRTQTRLINTYETIKWNMDKWYLQDLKERGIHIPQTIYIPKGSTATLQVLYDQIQGEEAVIKPTVSGGAKHTYRLNPTNINRHEELFQQLIQHEDFIIQPLLHDIVENGEISLMVFGGQYTHAVLKVAKAGDFRVQDNWGGTVHDYEPTPEEMQFAEQVVAACSPQPFYARVDIAKDNDGKLALMEVELLEPELWFRLFPKAAEVFADVVFDYLQ
jgi:glutathione synthase/RimK-type ligase-like ATP-grasp enzyme